MVGRPLLILGKARADTERRFESAFQRLTEWRKMQAAAAIPFAIFRVTKNVTLQIESLYMIENKEGEK